MNIEFAVKHLGTVREAIGEQLIPAFLGGGKKKLDITNFNIATLAVVEQVIATYVLAYMVHEVYNELRAEGKSVTLVNGENALAVRMFDR